MTTATAPTTIRLGRTDYEIRVGPHGYPIIWRIHRDGARTTPPIKTRLRVALAARAQGLLA